MQHKGRVKVKASAPAVTRPVEPAKTPLVLEKPPKAKAVLHVEAKRDDAKLHAERAEDWQGLAAVSSGSLFGEASPVDALVERYGLQPPTRPQEKFFEALSFIDQAVQGSKDPEKVAASLMNHDSRREIFRLESLLRLYGTELPGHLPLVKELEDHLGAVSTFAHALKNAKGAPPVVIERITQLLEASRTAVVALVKAKWLPGPSGRSQPVETLGRAFAAAELGSAKHDRKVFAGRLATVLDKLKDGSKQLSMGDLEGGVHKLRRQLRWVALYMESSGGLVQSKGSNLPKLKKGDEAIEVPAALYLHLQKLIEKLGDVKDDVERHELFSSAYEELGLDPAQLGKAGTPKDMETRATKLYDELQDAKLLKKLRNVFEEA